MSAEEFLALLKKYPAVEAGDLKQLAKIRSTHRYCQIVPILIARGLQDSQSPEATQAINQAAVITADRTLLRSLMTIEAKEFSAIQEIEPVVPVLEVDEPQQIQVTEKINLSVLDTPNEKSPEKLQPIAATAESAISEAKILEITVTKNEVIIEVPAATATNSEKDKVESADQEREGLAADTVMENLAELQSNKQKFQTLAEQVEEYLQQSGKHQELTGKGKIEVKEGDQLIREIKSSKKKQKSEAPQHTEQAAIIDQFIKARLEPIRADKNTIKQDLTATLETYSENVVSETLVDILLRQGKKEKALEVLRKLIWKFPQKKALFAARIQELSK